MARGSFALDITAFVRKVELRTDQAIRAIAFDLYDRITKRTPVDTGLLRSNWQIGVGAAPGGRLPIRSNYLQEEQSKLQQVSASTDVYIVNNLAYALVVEYGGYPNPPKGGDGKTLNGFSRQAPAGMLRISLIETQGNIDSIVRALK